MSRSRIQRPWSGCAGPRSPGTPWAGWPGRQAALMPGGSRGEPFTVSDLNRMPDDGHRCESLDGTLIVSLHPGQLHQRVAVMLCYVLELARPEDLIVVPNMGARIGPRSAWEPDA